jgi:hypothetical protein
VERLTFINLLLAYHGVEEFVLGQGYTISRGCHFFNHGVGKYC